MWSSYTLPELRLKRFMLFYNRNRAATAVFVLICNSLVLAGQWQVIDVGDRGRISAISFAADGRLWVGGESRVVTSQNGLTEWQSFDVDQNVGILANITAVEDNSVIAVGEGVSKYSLANGEWKSLINIDESSNSFTDYCKMSQNRGFVSSIISSRVTYDGDESFQRLNDDQAAEVPKPCFRGSVGDDGVVFIAGSADGTPDYFGMVARSKDSGTTWKSVVPLSPETRKLNFLSISTRDGQSVIATGQQYNVETEELVGKIIYSVNGGETWNQTSTEFSHPVTDVAMVDGSLAFCVDERGLLYRTTNAGLDWHPAEKPDGRRILSVAASKDGIIYIGGLSGLLARMAGVSSVSVDSTTVRISSKPVAISRSGTLRDVMGRVEFSGTVRILTIDGSLVFESTSNRYPEDIPLDVLNRGVFVCMISGDGVHSMRVFSIW